VDKGLKQISILFLRPLQVLGSCNDLSHSDRGSLFQGSASQVYDACMYSHQRCYKTVGMRSQHTLADHVGDLNGMGCGVAMPHGVREVGGRRWQGRELMREPELLRDAVRVPCGPRIK